MPKEWLDDVEQNINAELFAFGTRKPVAELYKSMQGESFGITLALADVLM